MVEYMHTSSSLSLFISNTFILKKYYVFLSLSSFKKSTKNFWNKQIYKVLFAFPQAKAISSIVVFFSPYCWNNFWACNKISAFTISSFTETIINVTLQLPDIKKAQDNFIYPV